MELFGVLYSLWVSNVIATGPVGRVMSPFHLPRKVPKYVAEPL